MLTVEPDPLTVALVDVDMNQALADPSTTTDAPVIVRTRVLLFEDENMPVVRVFAFRSSVPLVSAVVLVAPSVNASCNCHVPPTPLNVIGRSIVRPLVVMVLTPDVAANVVAFAPADRVMPDDKVRFPKIVLVPFSKEPANPVKSIFLAFPVKVNAYVPACILNEIDEVSASDPGFTVTATASA